MLRRNFVRVGLDCWRDRILIILSESMKAFPFLCALALAARLAATALADNWPQFRGPDGQGKSEARELPLTWRETNHVAWKTALHGRAWSSPVIWDQQVWLTTATDDGTKLFALCVDRGSGRVVRDLKLFDVEKPQFAHQFNTYASPSPVIEPDRVYATFGSPGTACLDTKTGKVLWDRRVVVLTPISPGRGAPPCFASLVVHDCRSHAATI